MIKAALFDLDGVLIDTEPVYSSIWTDIERHFPTGVENFAQAIKGTTLPNILDKYFRAEDHAAIIDMLHKAEDNMEYPLFPGTIAFLERLKTAGVPAAIVTSSGDKKMARIFATYPGFRDYFGSVVTDSRVKLGKPNPECYLLGAADLDVAPAECTVFEDSINGLISGRAAGAQLVALATTNPADALKEYTSLVVESLSDPALDTLFK